MQLHCFHISSTNTCARENWNPLHTTIRIQHTMNVPQTNHILTIILYIRLVIGWNYDVRKSEILLVSSILRCFKKILFDENSGRICPLVSSNKKNIIFLVIFCECWWFTDWKVIDLRPVSTTVLNENQNIKITPTQSCSSPFKKNYRTKDNYWQLNKPILDSQLEWTTSETQ